MREHVHQYEVLPTSSLVAGAMKVLSFFFFTTANPPFDDATIQRMVTHMEVLLNATAKPLSFAIIIPYLPVFFFSQGPLDARAVA